MSKCPHCPDHVSAIKLSAHLAQKHPNGRTPKKRQMPELCPVCNARFPDGMMGAHKKRDHADIPRVAYTAFAGKSLED